MQANVGKVGERQKSFEEKQARLAKMGGAQFKGDSEQRRSGWGNAENKAACFERGNTDRFKAQCPIWIRKEAMWAKEGKTTNGIGKGKKEKERRNQYCSHVWAKKKWAHES